MFIHILDSYCKPCRIDFSGIGKVMVDSQYIGIDGEDSYVKNKWINTNENLPSYF